MSRPVENSQLKENDILLSKNRLDYVLNSLESGAWELDLVTNDAWRSPQHDKIFGYSHFLDEWNFDIFLEHVLPEDRERVNELNKQVVADIRNWTFECRIRRNDGCVRWILSKGMHEVVEEKKSNKLFGVIQDITDKKLSEEKIRDSEQKYKSLYENAPLSYQSLNEDGSFKDVNPRWLQTLGYEREEVIGKKYIDFLHPDWQGHFEKNFPAFKKRGYVSDVHFKIRHKAGHYVDISFEGCIGYNPDGSFRQTYCVFQDITLRLKAENELKKSEERFRLLYNNSPDMYASVSYEDATILMCNDTLVRNIGYSREEAIGTSIFAMYHKDCLEEADNAFLEFKQTGIVNERELILKRKDGSKIDVSLKVYPVKDDSGNILYSIYSWRDITERKMTEEKIRAAEGNLQRTFDLSPSIICKADLDTGFFIEANQAVTRILGYSVEEFTSIPFMEMIHPDDREGSADEREEQRNGKAVTFFENRYLCKDGTYKWLAWHGTEADENGIVTAIGTDISDSKAREEEQLKLRTQLQQAQKMESVGRLAGGVAHDFNNMLGVILGHADILLSEPILDRNIQEGLEEIKKAGQRSAELTRQLLAFARKQTVSPKILDLNLAVEGMLKMLRRLIGEDINLIWKPGKDGLLINIDPSQLDQILANLCVNARDAIQEMGKITIETDYGELDKAYCLTHADAVPGEYSILAVSDDGEGMDRETLDYIFEPFFTTKEMGKGTGLGLSTIYGIVKQNKGFIDLFSEPGLGSTFKIYLPRHTDESNKKIEKDDSQLDVRGHETILLVEDEESILNMAKRILKKLGYTVLTANSPGEAMQLVENIEEPIHLLITDVVMPEMNGRDLAKKILTLLPNVKLLFMSGYTADVIAHHGVLNRGVHFIQKPFSITDLSDKVREALDHAM